MLWGRLESLVNNCETFSPQTGGIQASGNEIHTYRGVVKKNCRNHTQEKMTESHFSIFWVFKEYPQKSQIGKSETSRNQGTWLGIPWLGLVSLCQIWDFCGFSLNTLKYRKMGICYFFQ